MMLTVRYFPFPIVPRQMDVAHGWRASPEIPPLQLCCLPYCTQLQLQGYEGQGLGTQPPGNPCLLRQNRRVSTSILAYN